MRTVKTTSSGAAGALPKIRKFETAIDVTALALVAALSAAMLAGLFGTAQAAAVAPPLAPEVKAVPEGLVAPLEPYVAANDAELLAEPVYGAKATGEIKAGQKLEVVGEVMGRPWVLVGKNGVGTGYVSRALVCPERFCPARS